MTLGNKLATWFKGLMARRRTDAFVCGDCSRNQQCGAEPSAQCVVRAAQIESDRGRAPKRETFIGW